MKMKQVMAETGLSARTVRYYEEEGLFVPQTTVVNGRRIRAYTSEVGGSNPSPATMTKALESS